MKLDRLFHVLVVLGGASVASCDSASERRDRREDPPPDAAAGTTVDGGADLQPCFCDVQTCCDRAAEPAEVLDGFECCWSTTCP